MTSSSPTLMVEPPNCGIKTVSPTATFGKILLPLVSTKPGPMAKTLAVFNFSTFFSGNKIPEAVLASALTLWTKTRSNNGTMEAADFKMLDILADCVEMMIGQI
ncbi:hypothetical protein WICPIJ_005489 [Wickerhamomyces pijperi]|uniref:Uncharacterized protein n=1 Tax=Wickerhamomyces pijperi TaxID=599730 RepID=A0A9P8Q3U9_WICPI|nr:hypothetical protein WICPIJ_005489 [Wickerhamomyces pijperi]